MVLEVRIVVTLGLVTGKGQEVSFKGADDHLPFLKMPFGCAIWQMGS